MGFLIKSAFWLSLVLLVIPFDTGDSHQDGQVGAIQAFVAAGEAASDVAGMCQRKPEVCSIGKSALQTIEARARVGAKYAYKMLDKKLGETGPNTKTELASKMEPAVADASIKTGTVRKEGTHEVLRAPSDSDSGSLPVPSARPEVSD